MWWLFQREGLFAASTCMQASTSQCHPGHTACCSDAWYVLQLWMPANSLLIQFLLDEQQAQAQAEQLEAAEKEKLRLLQEKKLADEIAAASAVMVAAAAGCKVWREKLIIPGSY